MIPTWRFWVWMCVYDFLMFVELKIFIKKKKKIYMSHSVNKMNFAEGVVTQSTFYSCTIFKEINSHESFHISEDCLYWMLPPEHFLYWRVGVFPLYETGLSWQNQFVNNFLTRSCFSVHITHSSVNFTWFLLLSPSQQNGAVKYTYCSSTER